MYESHFGFSGSPFQLNPDPAFYFDSRGHSNALAYLKFGAHQGEGFIVVTGEIGAGKTTLVRTLLEGLNPEQVVAAQVVSTQLESGELLQAILMSFGIASTSTSKAHLIGSLEAFLTLLAAKGRRALLIIDEAQNLKHEAVEELRMLSNFQLGKHGLLQSFLVGQPELRQLLQSKSMEQLRQRVIASCHLGPLQPAETRAYIEHRLRIVGWAGRPEFLPDSFERIHIWTGGVPRKINRLCNRLLLGAFLANEAQISSALVDHTASELKSEIGELSEIPELPAAPERNVLPQARPEPVPIKAPAQIEPLAAAQPIARPRASIEAESSQDGRARVRLVPETPKVAVALGTALQPGAGVNGGGAMAGGAGAIQAVAEAPTSTRVEPKTGLTVVPAFTAAPAQPQPAPTDSEKQSIPSESAARLTRRNYRAGNVVRPLICLADSASDFLKAGTLAEVLLKFADLPPVIAFHPGSETSLTFGDTGANELPMPFVGLHVDGLEEPFAPRVRQLLLVFDGVLTEFNPLGVLAMGNSDAVLACSLLAKKRGVRLFRVAGGQRQAEGGAGTELNGALIDKMSDALYVNRMDSYYTLYQEGIKSDRVLCVGNLVGDMLRYVLPHAPSPDEVLAELPVPLGMASVSSGFALLAAEFRREFQSPQALSGLVDFLCELGAELPIIWPATGQVIQRLQTAGFAQRLRSACVHVFPAQGYLQHLGLLEDSKCLLTDSESTLVDEAGSLRVPTARLHWNALSSSVIVDPESQPSSGTSDKPLDVIRQLLSIATPQPESPTYWDSGTATRIANHLLLWLPQSDDAGYPEA